MSSEYKVCPTCGTEYPANERFCPRDGTALRSPSQGTDLVGSVVADRYHVLRKLGEGGMGQVYLAEHVKMQRKSALKVMHPGMVHDADAIARFNREAANAARINHPHVASIYDFGETPDGLIYLAMEFVEGQPLTKLIEQQGALPPARAAEITCQAGDALAVAHDMGIVHRDLKPDNIMIAKNRDGSDCVKVVDFGIAKAAGSDAQKVTKTGLVVGTPEYMSPEQLSGDRLDGRSDIYSLGLVAFNMLTGRLPFPSETVQEAMIMRLTDRPRTLAEMKADVAWPPAMEQVMAKALARDAKDRYQSASEFGRDLVRAVERMPRSAAFGAPAGATAMVGGVTAMLPKTNVSSPARPSAGTAVMDGATPPPPFASGGAPGAPGAVGGAATRAGLPPLALPGAGAAAGAGAGGGGGAAVADKPGSKMPLVIGGLATAVLAAGIAVFALGNGRDEGTDVTGGTAKTGNGTVPSAETTASGTGGAGVTPLGTDATNPSTPPRDTTRGGLPGAGQTKTLGRPVAQRPAPDTTPTPNRTGTPIEGAPLSSGTLPYARLDALSSNEIASEEDMRAALDQINRALPRIVTRGDSVHARYLRASFNARLDNRGETCRELKALQTEARGTRFLEDVERDLRVFNQEGYCQ